MAFDDFDDLVDYVVLQPQGDRLCRCACGCAREILPEEADVCADCDVGRHPSDQHHAEGR
jgi:hypothetical protein